MIWVGTLYSFCSDLMDLLFFKKIVVGFILILKIIHSRKIENKNEDK